MSAFPIAVIVTGTSRGIGEAICAHLLSLHSNCTVIGIARHPPSADSSLSSNPRYKHIQGSVTESSVIDRALDAFGQDQSQRKSVLKGLVLNAGQAEPFGKIAELDVDQVRKAFEVNLFGHVQLVHQALPFLTKNHTSVILGVTSGVARFPFAGWFPYCATKAALNMFLQTLAKEELEIISLAIEPGVVDTTMVQAVKSTDKIEGMKGMQTIGVEGPSKALACTVLAHKEQLEAKNIKSGQVLKWTDL